MIPELIRDALPDAPVLILTIGFLPEDREFLLDLAPAGQVIDLDTVDPRSAVADPASGAVAVLARTFTDLRRAASLTALLPKAAHQVVAVAQAHPDRPFSPAAPDGPVSFLARRGRDGEWSVEAGFAGPSPVGRLVAALVRGADGNGLHTMPGPRVALAGAGASHWRPGDPAAALTTMNGPLGDPDDVPPADLVLRSTGPDPAEWADPRIKVVIDRPRITDQPYDMDMVPPVDERSVNPTGFVSTPKLGDAALTRTGDRWSVQVDPETLVRFHPSGAVTDADVARLRQLRTVTIEWGAGEAPLEAARLVAGLAAAGVPLRAAHEPPWATALGGELAELITGSWDHDLSDDLTREEHSVRLRRAALRDHSAGARWRSLAGAAGLPVPARPTVSVVLCTRRPEFLEFALRQISYQRHVDLELILTLHGIPADLAEVKAAVAGFDRPITVVEVPSDVLFGETLNRGIARASGRYVAKWDDDDWYSPDFLADMLLASSYTGAELVGCRAQFVYLGQIHLTIYRPARSEWMGRLVAGGTFVIERSALDSVGGFPLVPRHVDAALLDALSAAGARIYSTHSLGYALHRRAAGHTWNEPITYFLRSAALQWRGLRFSAFIDPADTPLPPTSIGPAPK